MVKLFKNAMHLAMQNTRRIITLIEKQTFFFDAIPIVNDGRLTTLGDQPDDLLPTNPASFLGQEPAPNTPLGEFLDKGDLQIGFFV